MASVLIEAGGFTRRCSAVHVSRDLLVERLLFLLLGRIEVQGSRRLYACDVDVLLRAGLMHGQLSLRPVLAEGWLLRRRI